MCHDLIDYAHKGTRVDKKDVSVSKAIANTGVAPHRLTLHRLEKDLEKFIPNR